MSLRKSRRDKSLRKYFSPPKRRLKLSIPLIAIGVIIGISSQWNGEGAFILPGIALVALGFILMIIIPSIGVPSDSEVDKWLNDGIEKLKGKSLSKLNLGTDDVKNFTPLVFRGLDLDPLGIDDEDLLPPKLGHDNFTRCSVYKITIIYLTERHLAAYICDYNLIKDLALNEKTSEYYYQDIVGLVTEEISTSALTEESKFRSCIRLVRSYIRLLGKIIRHEPRISDSSKANTQLKFIGVQEFRISVTNQEKIEVVISAEKYTDDKGKIHEFKLPPTDVERAVGVIRNKLKAIKASGMTKSTDSSSSQQGAKMPFIMKCLNCDAPIQAEWNKCPKCGAILPAI